VVKAKQTGFWFYGNEKFLITAISLALGATGFAVGGRISKASVIGEEGDKSKWSEFFRLHRDNLHDRPFISEYYHPIHDTQGVLLCVLRVRVHEGGKVSLLGVRTAEGGGDPLVTPKRDTR